MDNSFEQKEYYAVADGGRFDIDDIFTFGVNYFFCGWSRVRYYNHSFSIAISLIGALYGDKTSSRSDYHNGVDFIARNMGITKRQIKVLRKKAKHKGGYSFRTPFSIPVIINQIIELLKNQEQEPNVQLFLSRQASQMYREILIKEQFESIKEAARKGERTKVKKVADDLKSITTKVGE